VESLLLIDGSKTDFIPVQDRGLQYGDGLFETMRTQNGDIRQKDLHLARLQAGCARLGINLEVQLLQERLHEFMIALAKISSGDSVVKLIVTRGDGGRGYTPPANVQPRIILQNFPLPAASALLAQSGVDCIICTHPVSLNPRLAGLKHLNRLDQVMGSHEVASAALRWPAVAEGLMTDGHGTLIEATRSNVFFVIRDVLCTPELSQGGVAGITRTRVLDHADSLQWRYQVRTITCDELVEVSAAFLCNAVMGVVPINQIFLSDGTHLSLPDRHHSNQLQHILA
jgi:4-amino-4-deoxychorismate lyase